MADSGKLLIVEGEADKAFMRKFMEVAELDLVLDIRVAIAPELNDDIRHTTKQAVFESLATVIKQLDDGGLTHIGVLVDMDFRHDDPMPIKERNLRQLSEKLEPHGFSLNNDSHEQGLFYTNDDFDQPIGVWLMPNNEDEGYLETWLLKCASPNSKEHLDKANQFVSTFENIKLHNQNKASVYSWLATQEKPSLELSKLLSGEGLIDKSSDTFLNFKAWLEKTFQD